MRAFLITLAYTTLALVNRGAILWECYQSREGIDHQDEPPWRILYCSTAVAAGPRVKPNKPPSCKRGGRGMKNSGVPLSTGAIPLPRRQKASRATARFVTGRWGQWPLGTRLSR